MLGEAGSANREEAETFKQTFQDIVEEGGYLPDQIFNADETGLFWKKMPDRTFISANERRIPGRKMMKDRLTLLFCANASGGCPVKPMLVYKSETPRAFLFSRVNPDTGRKETLRTNKDSLPVFWKSNRKAWVTRVLFEEWLNKVFAKEVKEYLLKRKLELKALLVLDNAPGHPPEQTGLKEENQWIKVSFFPLFFFHSSFSFFPCAFCPCSVACFSSSSS